MNFFVGAAATTDTGSNVQAEEMVEAKNASLTLARILVYIVFLSVIH